jgi:hypothetical protein
VTTANGTSATVTADQFNYAAGPTITSISPGAGPASGGTTVTISGTNLGAASAVRFGTAAAASFVVSSNMQITAISPPGIGRVHVTVTTAGGTSANVTADQFTYTLIVNCPDTSVSVIIGPGTQGLTNAGQPLSYINVVRMATGSPVPGGIRIPFDFQPTGASFNPPITITFKYDLAQLPAGADPRNLFIAYWNVATSAWITLPSVVDTAAGTVSAQVDHFSIYMLDIKAVVTPATASTIPWPMIAGIIGVVFLVVIVLLLVFLPRKPKGRYLTLSG